MFRWYAVNTYSGHEKKVKQNLEHRVQSMGAQRNVRLNMDLNEDTWTVVKGTPGVTGFVGPQNKPVRLSQGEVDRLLKREQAERPRTRAQFSIGESVKVVSGPLSDFSAAIS